MIVLIFLLLLIVMLIGLAFLIKRTFDQADDISHGESYTHGVKTQSTVYPPKGKKEWYGH